VEADPAEHDQADHEHPSEDRIFNRYVRKRQSDLPIGDGTLNREKGFSELGGNFAEFFKGVFEFGVVAVTLETGQKTIGAGNDK
jgi:hypothetical protein